jgi:hypothetical protein
MAQTEISQAGFSSLVTQLVVAQAEEELRARAVHAMPGMYVPGRFVKGTNTIRFARYADLGLASVTAVLTEGTKPTEQALTISSEFYTAAQYGGTVQITDLANLDSPHDLISVAAERIAYQATRLMDVLVRNGIHNNVETAAIFTATASQTVSANGATALSPISGWQVKRMVASLKAANVPTFPDGFYRCIIHPNQEFDLLTDTTTNGWLELNKYVSDLPALTNEIGRFAGVRFITSSDAHRATTAAPTTYAAAGANYNALFLGPDAYTIGDSQTLQSYFVAPGGDHTDPLAQMAVLGFKMRWGSMLIDEAGARYRVLRTTSTI